MVKKILFFLLIAVTFFCSCGQMNYQEPALYNVNTFPLEYRELIMCVNKEDTLGIINTVKENNLNVNFKDPEYKISILKWAIANRKYYSCKALLELGANPNQADSNDYVPPVTTAAGITETSVYLKLLLEHRGNPNIITKKEKGDVQYTEATPLCAAASARLESVKLLIDHGADINLSAYGILPLTTALIAQKIDIAEFMIVDRKADINQAYTVRIKNDTARVADLLRLNLFPLESEEFKQKMEIVNYLKTLGIDYRASPIPKYLFENYPKEFLEKY